MGTAKELKLNIKVTKEGFQGLAEAFTNSFGGMETAIGKLQNSFARSMNSLKRSMNAAMANMGRSVGESFAKSMISAMEGGMMKVPTSVGNTSSKMTQALTNKVRQFGISKMGLEPSKINSWMQSHNKSAKEWKSYLQAQKEEELWLQQAYATEARTMKISQTKPVKPVKVEKPFVIPESLKNQVKKQLLKTGVGVNPSNVNKKLDEFMYQTIDETDPRKKAELMQKYLTEQKELAISLTRAKSESVNMKKLEKELATALGPTSIPTSLMNNVRKTVLREDPHANTGNVGNIVDKMFTGSTKERITAMQRYIRENQELEIYNSKVKKSAISNKTKKQDILNLVSTKNGIMDDDSIKYKTEGFNNLNKLAALSDKTLGPIKDNNKGLKFKTAKTKDTSMEDFQSNLKDLTSNVKDFFGTIDTSGNGIVGMITNSFEKMFSVVKYGIGIIGTMSAGVTGAAYFMKEWGTNILLTTERFRGFNIAMLGTLKTQSAVDNVMKASLNIAKDLPIGIEQIYSGTKAMTLISPLQSMFKDSKNLETNLKDVWDIVIALSQIEPEWGIQGALYSLRETLSGDFMSMKRRYEIPVDVMMTADGKPLESIKKDIPQLLKGLHANFKDLVPAETLRLTANQFGPVLQKIQGSFEQLKSKIGEMGFYDVFVSDMKKIESNLSQFVSSGDGLLFAKKMSNAFEDAWTEAKKFTQNVVGLFNSVFGTNLVIDTSSITTTISDLSSKIVSMFQFVNGMMSSTDFISIVKEFVTTTKTYVIYFFNLLKSVIPEIYKTVMGLISGISNAWGKLTNFTGKFIDDATLVKGLFLVWVVGFGNIVSAIGPALRILSSFKSVAGNIFTILGKDFPKIKFGDQMDGAYGAAEKMRVAFGSILTAVTRIYMMFVALPNFAAMTMEAFDLFEFSPMGVFWEEFKARYGFGTPSKTKQFEKLNSDYEQKIGGRKVNDEELRNGMPMSLNGILPASLKGFMHMYQQLDLDKKIKMLDYIDIENTHQSLPGFRTPSRTIKDPSVQSIIDFTRDNKYDQSFNTYQDKMNAYAIKAKELGEKYGEGFVEHMLYIADPRNVFKSFETLKDKTIEYGSNLLEHWFGGKTLGLADFKNADPSKPISLSGWKQEDLKSVTKFNESMKQIFGNDYNDAIYSANDKVHKVGSDHYRGKAMDIQAFSAHPEMLNSSDTYRIMAEEAKKVGAKQILLGKGLENPDSIKALLEAGPELKGFLIRFETSAESMGKLPNSIHFAMGGSGSSGMGRVGGAVESGLDAMNPRKEAFTQEDFKKIYRDLINVGIGDFKSLQANLPLVIKKNASIRTGNVLSEKSDSMMQQIMGDSVPFGQDALEKYQQNLDNSFGDPLKYNYDKLIGPYVNQMLKQIGFEKQSTLDFIRDKIGNYFTSINPDEYSKMEKTYNTAKQNSGPLFEKKMRVFAKDNYQTFAPDFDNLGIKNYTAGLSEADIIMRSLLASTMNLVSIKFPNRDKDAKSFLNSAYKISGEKEISTADALKEALDIKRKEILKNITDPKEFQRQFVFYQNIKKEIDDSFEKVSPFRLWQKDLEIFNNNLKDTDFREPLKMAELLNNKSLNREQKSSVYSGIQKGLEYGQYSGIDAFKYGMESATVEFKNWGEQMYEAGGTIVSGLSSAFETGFFDMMTGKLTNLSDMFSSIGRSIINTIGQIISKMLAVSATKIILGIDINSGGGFGGQNGGGGLAGMIGGLTGSNGNGGLGGVLANVFGGGTGKKNSGSFVGNILNSFSGSTGKSNGNVFGAGGSIATAWGSAKTFMAANPLALPVAAAGMFLSQPGRIFGGAKDDTQAGLAAYQAASGSRETMVSRRQTDAEKYMMSGKSNGIFGYGFGQVGYNTWSSGDGWFKGPNENHSAADTTSFTNSMKDYYKMLEIGAAESYQNQKNINELRKTNEVAALKQEMDYKKEYLSLVVAEYTRAISADDYKVQDELRDKIYEMQASIDDMTTQMTEASKAMTLRIKEGMIASGKSYYSMLTEIGSMKYLKDSQLYSKTTEKSIFGNKTEKISGYIPQMLALWGLENKNIQDPTYTTNTYDNAKFQDLAPYLGQKTGLSSGLFGEDLTKALENVKNAIMSSATLSNTRQNADYNKENYFTRVDTNKNAYAEIKKLEYLKTFYREDDLLTGGAQAFADANLKITEYYGEIAQQISAWVDAGYLKKAVENISNLSEGGFNLWKDAVNKAKFKGNMLSSMKGYSSWKELTPIYDEFVKAGGSNDLMNLKGQKYTTTGNGQMTDFGWIGSSQISLSKGYEDPFTAYFNFMKDQIKTKIDNEASISTTSEAYYAAQEELFALMQEKAENLKQKNADAMKALEDLLNGIGETMKLRISEEAKSSKGDVIFMDIRKTEDMAAEISRLAKSNDPKCAELIATLKKKLTGV